MSPTLASNCRGALALPGLMMVLLLIALTYGIFGLSETLLMKEGLQDAADAAALSSAIFHARGMNLLAFINLLMAALIAVLVAIRLAQGLMALASALLLALSIFGGATAPLAALTSQQVAHLERAYRSAKKVVFPLLTALHRTERATKVIVPWVATADSLVEAAKYHEPALGGFALPGSTSLPVEPDRFEVLCEHGGEMVAALALLPLEFIGVPEGVLSAAERAAGELASSMSGFLCGSGKGQAPEYKQKVPVRRPKIPGLEDCETKASGPSCRKARETLKASQPSGLVAQCLPHKDCSVSGPYEYYAGRARKECWPRKTQAKRYVWQETDVVAHYSFLGGKWVHKSTELAPMQTQSNPRDPSLPAISNDPRRIRTTDRAPCGAGGLIGDDWNFISGPPRGLPRRTLVEPLCISREAVQMLQEPGRPGSQRDFYFTQVTRLFSCVTEEERTFKMADEKDSFGKDGQGRTPHRLEDKLDLGDEAFQIRAVAFGPKAGPGTSSEVGVRLAPGKEPSASFSPMAQRLSHLSVAQAEYYFDHEGDVPAAEWLWNLDWRARLTRFRLPESQDHAAETAKKTRSRRDALARADREEFGGQEPTGSGRDACRRAGGGDCADTDQLMEVFNALVVH